MKNIMFFLSFSFLFDLYTKTQKRNLNKQKKEDQKVSTPHPPSLPAFPPLPPTLPLLASLPPSYPPSPRLKSVWTKFNIQITGCFEGWRGKKVDEGGGRRTRIEGEGRRRWLREGAKGIKWRYIKYWVNWENRMFHKDATGRFFNYVFSFANIFLSNGFFPD